METDAFSSQQRREKAGLNAKLISVRRAREHGDSRDAGDTRSADSGRLDGERSEEMGARWRAPETERVAIDRRLLEATPATWSLAAMCSLSRWCRSEPRSTERH